MKFVALFAFVVAAVTSTAFAADRYPLAKGDVALVSIGGQVKGVSSLCPEGMACITNGTVIDLSFMLGCMNKLGPVTSDAILVGDTLHVYVSAFEIVTDMNSRARCIAPTFADSRITLINQYGSDVKVHFLGSSR